MTDLSTILDICVQGGSSVSRRAFMYICSTYIALLVLCVYHNLKLEEILSFSEDFLLRVLINLTPIPCTPKFPSLIRFCLIFGLMVFNKRWLGHVLGSLDSMALKNASYQIPVIIKSFD